MYVILLFISLFFQCYQSQCQDCNSMTMEIHSFDEWFSRRSEFESITSLTLIYRGCDEYCLPSTFCSDLTSLESLTLQGFEGVTEIGDDVFLRCENLRSICLSSLSSVESVGKNFLFSCTSLSKIEWGDKSKVKTLPHSFLAHCTKLKTIDLSGFTGVETIDNQVMFGCENLTTVVFPLLSCKKVGAFFMASCSKLTSFDIDVFRNVESIDDYFLLGTGVKTLDLRSFPNPEIVKKAVRDGFILCQTPGQSNLSFNIQRMKFIICACCGSH